LKNSCFYSEQSVQLSAIHVNVHAMLLSAGPVWSHAACAAGCNAAISRYVQQYSAQHPPHQAPTALSAVTRFEEAIAAAKAYDKAAVYLYGASAITNFGLEACLAGKYREEGDKTDPTQALWHKQLHQQPGSCVQIAEMATCRWQQQ
jgi:hypothetical protein